MGYIDPITGKVQNVFQKFPSVKLVDLKLWYVDHIHYGAGIKLESESQQPVTELKKQLTKFGELQFLMLEAANSENGI